MITYVTGDLFHSPAQVLVNTVNTVGVMGKGIALEFKRIYPDMFRSYQRLCEHNMFHVGQLWLWKSPNKWVLNFPTKKHWRSPSRPEYIEAGLKKFQQAYNDLSIHSIAFPALGCGNGELDFDTQVRPLMEQYLKDLPIDIFIYADRNDPYQPEHTEPKKFRQWLRNQPRALSFSEVWDDIQAVLVKRKTFRTLHGNNEFTIEMLLDEGIRIVSAGHIYKVEKETLRNFWQQLRDYGFSTRKIAPGINKNLSYILPLFAELPYIKVARLAEMTGRHLVGLQYVPGLVVSPPSDREQMPLFELT